jgi:hypothetical protein
MRGFLPSLSLLLLISVAMPNSGADKNEKRKSALPNLEISPFDVAKDVDVPPDFLERLAKELPHQLAGTKKFKLIFSHGDAPADLAGTALQLKETLIDFNPGSRAKRYLIGYGIGAAQVVAHVKLTDPATGQTVFERDIPAKMIGGGFGGSVSGVADQLAREIARALKKGPLP